LGLDPFGSSSGSHGFSPAPTSFDVFTPGTSANNAFVHSVNQMAHAVKNFCAKDAKDNACQQDCADTLERDEAECLVAKAGYGKVAQAICLGKAKNYMLNAYAHVTVNKKCTNHILRFT
jgi:hypothetical protein